MKDEELKKLVETIGYKEGLPVVVNPGVLDPKEFIDTVLQVRVPNPFMPDTPQRIATDTSQKLAIRFGETIKAYAASDELDVKDLKLIPLVFAGWLRYLMGVIISVTSSFTPGMELNSCRTPSIFTELMAAPGREESMILLRELPNVIPYPLSRGSTTNFPYFLSSEISVISIFGLLKSNTTQTLLMG